MELGKFKLGFWYWFWYGYLWCVILLIPGIIALTIIEGIEIMLVVRAIWIIPFGIWWGFREIKKEKEKAIQRYFNLNNQ